jgi:hypothetical protein
VGGKGRDIGDWEIGRLGNWERGRLGEGGRLGDWDSRWGDEDWGIRKAGMQEGWKVGRRVGIGGGFWIDD